jgi:hypothetical protein
VADAYFAVLDEDDGGGRYLASPATAGPWDPASQHGGPPSALLVRAAERLAAATTGRDDLLAARLAVDFVGAVPVAELALRASVVRSGRSAVLVEAALSDGTRTCLHGRVWLLARSDTADVAHDGRPDRPPEREPRFGLSFPYSDSIDWHEMTGSILVPGPASVWARPRLPLAAADTFSPLQLATLVGDSASGISSALDWRQWSFLNVDLDVHLFRPLAGDWLYMAAETQLGPQGSALARSTLGDVAGPAGGTAQTLLLTRRAH